MFLSKKNVDPNVTPVRRRPSIDFSLTGVVYVAMMLFMGLAAMNSQANLLFGVFGLMIGILLVSGVICMSSGGVDAESLRANCPSTAWSGRR